MKRILLFTVFSLFAIISAFGQTDDSNGYLPNFNPPSPESSALGKYVEHPVGYYTGTPRINIPLFEIKCGRITLPISLSYHGSGVKVDEVASRVGTGWVLNAGGVVTRTLKGEWCDEAKFGYFAYLAAGTSVGIPAGYDTEPDQHFYNFNGKMGQIFFTDKTHPHTTNLDPIKIDGPYNGNNRFIITTEDGLIYTFEATEQSDILSIGGNSGTDNYFTSSWYLTRIDDPVTGKNIQFVYRSDMQHALAYTQENSISQGILCDLNAGTSIAVNNFGISILAPKVLQEIIYDEGYIELKADYGRPDFSYDKAYTEINQYEYNGNTPGLLKKGFNLSYFSQLSSSSGAITQDNYRIYLESIQEKGSDNSLLPPYSFYYKNRDLLPRRNSVHQDIWGYYNANNGTEVDASQGQSQGFSKVYITPNNGRKTYLPLNSNFNPAPQIADGVERATNPATVDYGTLNKIIYPTKGYTIYNYEPNMFDVDEYTGGGIRIKEITDYAADGSQLLDKKYYYNSSGKLGGAYPNVAFTQPWTPLGHSQLIQFTKNQSMLGTAEGSYVGYGYVEEAQTSPSGNNGFTHYLYSQDQDIDSSIPPNSAVNCISIADVSPTSYYPFFELESRENRRGILQHQYFMDNAGNFIKGIDYNYDLLSQNITYITSFRFSVDYRSGSINGATPGSRNLNAEKMLLTSKVESEYKNSTDLRALNPIIQNTTNYTYTDGAYAGAFKRSETLLESGNRQVTTSYKYPFDYASTASGGVMGTMVAMNYINPVISKISTKDMLVNSAAVTYYTDATINNYMVNPNYPNTAVNNIVPAQIYKLNLSVPVLKPAGAVAAVEVPDPSNPGSQYEKRLDYLAYDSFSNTTEVKVDNQYELFNWSVYDQLLSKTHSATPPNSSGQKTIYTYDSMNRLQSITDPGNKKRSYEYDAFSRLINIRDQDGYIISSYCYNYAGQQTGCQVPVVSTPYVMMTLASTITDANNHTINTYTFKVYADENLTTLYSVPANLTVKYKLTTTVTHSSGTPAPSTTSTTPTIVIPAGSNQVTTGPIDVYGCTGGSLPAVVQTSTVQNNKQQTAGVSGGASPNSVQPGDSICTSSSVLLQGGTGYIVGGAI
ncbi:RHS repeat domain-containing protein [Mucilaginibacter sp. OK098]|uniref:RHS repeat domain-containing protein n=1 Tax=Mucilaginibacter sp. OK098 TaxID=1855297 RepID=UPI000910BAF5|nr:RHS repeat domain-containing protein [Mucilaginibacter sp. OK098]SHM16827.1 YD repeat-containing protein [Mucilaginibacter sp. OK098]